MFVHEPQIEADEARYPINEVVNSITKSRALEDVLVVISLPYEHDSDAYHHNNSDKPFTPYNKNIFPRFDKYIEIMNDGRKTHGIYRKQMKGGYSKLLYYKRNKNEKL
jgi:hypothetical protein